MKSELTTQGLNGLHPTTACPHCGDDVLVEDPAIARLTKDLREAMKTMTAQEARYYVDRYYQEQNNRIRNNAQVRTMAEEPHSAILWLAEQESKLEQQIKAALGSYANGSPVGRWAQTITGIGPVIAAGLMAHIDVTKAETVGSVWRYAGLDPTLKWDKGQKRPWNAQLKALCWKIGESFVKVSTNAKDIYGKIYVQRKEQEWARNLTGAFADQAKARLEAKPLGKGTDAYKWYSGQITMIDAREWLSKPAKSRSSQPKVEGEGKGTPMLPPAHIHQRSARYAVKLFLSHWHHVAYEAHYGTPPPKPYIFTRPEHTHFMQPPGWP